MAEEFKTIEQEITDLERVLVEKKAALEQQKERGEIEEIPHEKEILREAIRERIQTAPAPAGPIPQPSPPSPTAETPSYLSEELRPKVQELVNLAFEKSLDEAIKTAKATGNEALIDAFHDALVDEMYNHLVERKKLESIR